MVAIVQEKMVVPVGKALEYVEKHRIGWFG
jgi:hypothetical protein